MKAFKWIWVSLMILCLLSGAVVILCSMFSQIRRKWICRRCRKSTAV